MHQKNKCLPSPHSPPEFIQSRVSPVIKIFRLGVILSPKFRKDLRRKNGKNRLQRNSLLTPIPK
jgi:hypothetical protein